MKKPQKAECHPKRKVKARGLCHSCYNYQHQQGKIKVREDYHYGEALVEEIKFMDDLDWDQLSRMFKRPKAALYQNLYHKDKHDLIAKVNRAHQRRHGPL